MGNVGGFASGLAEEMLGEMAESFFGSRKRLDERIEYFATLAHELRSTQEKVVRLGSGLLALLPGVDEVAMARALGIEPDGGVILPSVPHPQLPQLDALPRGLTLGSRYAKVVLRQYDAYQRGVNEYMHGKAGPHPEHPKRMVMTLHYGQLYFFARQLNESIEEMNSGMPASCVIRYASSFVAPDKAGKEHVTGAHCPYSGSTSGGTDLDEQYAYQPIDFESYGLAAFADLPLAKEAAPGLRRLCSELRRIKKATVVSTMAALQEMLRI